MFILFAASAFRKLSSIYVFSYFPFGFEGRIWDLIVSVPDHCLSFYFTINVTPGWNKIERLKSRLRGFKQLSRKHLTLINMNIAADSWRKVNFMPSWLFVFQSRMVSGEGSGIRLPRFLIIAFSSTLNSLITFTSTANVQNSRYHYLK